MYKDVFDSLKNCKLINWIVFSIVLNYFMVCREGQVGLPSPVNAEKFDKMTTFIYKQDNNEMIKILVSFTYSSIDEVSYIQVA